MENSKRELQVEEVNLENKRQKRSEINTRRSLNKSEKLNKEKEPTRYAANRDKVKARSTANKEVNSQQRKVKNANREAIKANYEKHLEVLIANGEYIPRRERKNPNKMWSVAEESALINFMKKNAVQSTKRAFYDNFIHSTGVNVDWKMVRSKIFNMRRAYERTKNWLNTSGEAISDRDAVRNTILNKCPFYYDFAEIFSLKNFRSSTISDNCETSITNLGTINNQNSDEVCIPTAMEESEVEIEIIIESTVSVSDESMSQSEPPFQTTKHQSSFPIGTLQQQNDTDNILTEDTNFSKLKVLLGRTENEPIENVPDNFSTTKCRADCIRLAVSKVMQSQAEILRLKKEKMKFESIYREKEMELLERNIVQQEKKLNFKENKLKSQEEVKMLELKMKERIAMKELEFKYKN